MTAHPRDEVEAVVTRYCDVRRRIDAGELPWDSLAQFFTDDCVYIDPAWGRVEGIGPVSEFFEESMRGLEDWEFPIEFAAIDGDNVVVKWLQVLPGTRAGRLALHAVRLVDDGLRGRRQVPVPGGPAQHGPRPRRPEG